MYSVVKRVRGLVILTDGCARGTGATWTPALVDFTGGSHGVGHRNVGEPWFSSHGGGCFGSVHLPEFEGTSVPDQRGERPDTWPQADQTTNTLCCRGGVGGVEVTITRFSPALALVMLAAGSAHCADVVRFKGTTVTFRVEASSVKGFTLTASALCLAGSKSTNEIRVIPVEEPARLDGDGHFTLAFDKSGTRLSVIAASPGRPPRADSRSTTRRRSHPTTSSPAIRNSRSRHARRGRRGRHDARVLSSSRASRAKPRCRSSP